MRRNHEKSPQNAGHEKDNAHEVELMTAPQSRIVQAQNKGAERRLLEGAREVSCHTQRIKVKMALNCLAALALRQWSNPFETLKDNNSPLIDSMQPVCR